jgi:hypothetical protein
VRYPNLLMLWRREELRRIAANGEGARVEQMEARLAELVRGIVAAGVRSGVFRVVDPGATARAILGAIQGMAGSLAGRAAPGDEVGRALAEIAGFVRQSLLHGADRRAG